MPGLSIRPTSPGDPEKLAPNLRHADLRDCALDGLEPLEALLEGYNSSATCFTVQDASGDVLGMFGVGEKEDNKDIGIPWLLGTERLVQNRTWFLRSSRVLLNAIGSRYTVLMNKMDQGNVEHLRWVLWLGFRIVGHEGRAIHFARVNNV